MKLPRWAFAAVPVAQQPELKKAKKLYLWPAVCFTVAAAAGIIPAAAIAQSPTTKAPDPATAPKPAASGGASLAEIATNPLGNLVQIMVQDQYNGSTYTLDSDSNTFIIQPIIPIKLKSESVPLLITRTTMAYVSTPDFGGDVGRQNGFGDIFSLFLALPKLKDKAITFGIGPAVNFPTASNDFTGSGKWEAGPAVVYVNSKKKGWQWGMLGWQVWSFAGDSDRDAVSSLSVQPLLVRHFDKGLYAGWIDVPATYDWKKSRWNSIPLGLKVGKVTKWGKQNMNLFAEALYSPQNGDIPTSQWSFKVSATFLFPK